MNDSEEEREPVKFMRHVVKSYQVVIPQSDLVRLIRNCVDISDQSSIEIVYNNRGERLLKFSWVESEVDKISSEGHG